MFRYSLNEDTVCVYITLHSCVTSYENCCGIALLAFLGSVNHYTQSRVCRWRGNQSGGRLRHPPICFLSRSRLFIYSLASSPHSRFLVRFCPPTFRPPWSRFCLAKKAALASRSSDGQLPQTRQTQGDDSMMTTCSKPRAHKQTESGPCASLTCETAQELLNICSQGDLQPDVLVTCS